MRRMSSYNVTRRLVWLPSCFALLLAGCGGGGGGEPPVMPVPVETISVGSAPVEDRLSAIGTIMPNESVTVSSEISGRIAEIGFVEGERVEAGDVLFELDSSKEAAQVAQAKADLEFARQNAKRARALSGTRAISEQEIDQIESEVALKEAAFNYQQERLDQTTLIAPFAGALGPRNVSLGQFVNAGEPLVTLTDDLMVKISYQLPEEHAAKLKLGQSVTVRVAAYPDREFAGEVHLIDPQIDPVTRTIRVRAVAANPDGALRPGMFARIETVTGTRGEALVIPERALIPSLEGFAVYLVRSNTAYLTPVQLGMRLSGEVEIREGLSLGQELIVGGLQKIIDGAAVNPSSASGAPPPSPSAQE